jgi:hypothetical protein
MEPKKCEQFSRDCFYNKLSLNFYAENISPEIHNRQKQFSKWTQQIDICSECIKQKYELD